MLQSPPITIAKRSPQVAETIRSASPRVAKHRFLVAGAFDRSHVVTVWRRRDVAEIDRAEPRDQIAAAKHTRRAIEVPLFPSVIRPDSETGRSADHRNPASHRSPQKPVPA